jgi:O-antigen/teichoic acid export membrane protein
LVWGVTDQALSSATNFGLSILAGRLLGASGLGVVFLGFSVYLLAQSFVRGLVIDPFVVATATLARARQEAATRALMILVIGAGATVSGLMVIGGLLFDGAIARGLLIFAPWAGVAMIQDQWRSVLFQDQRGSAAAVNDCVWALGMLAMLPVALTFRYDWVIAATWGAGAAAAALVGFAQVRLRPGRVRDAFAWWKRDLRRLGSWFTVQNVAFGAVAQLTVVLLAGRLGVGDLGGMRAVEVVFAPMTLVGDAFAFPGVPIVARALAISRAAARRWAWQLSGGACVLVGAYLAVVTPLSEPVLSHLFGPEFAIFTALVLPIALTQLVRAASTGFSILLKAGGHVHAISLGRGIAVVLRLVLGPMFAARYGVEAAMWGLALGSAAGATATIVCGLLSRDAVSHRRGVA